MLAPGQKLATDLELTVVQDGTSRSVPLAKLLPRRTVVSVYMRNNTGSCDRQTDALVRVAPSLGKAGFNLLAVSRDTVASHLKYAAKKEVSFGLVSDPEDRFARAAEAIVEKSMYGRTYEGPARCAFVLARDGTVLGVIPKVDPAAHDEQLLALVRTL